MAQSLGFLAVGLALVCCSELVSQLGPGAGAATSGARWGLRPPPTMPWLLRHPRHRALAVPEWPPGTLMGRPSPCGSVLQPGSSSGHLPVTSLGTKCHQSKEPKHGGDFSWFHGTEDA